MSHVPRKRVFRDLCRFHSKTMQKGASACGGSWLPAPFKICSPISRLPKTPCRGSKRTPPTVLLLDRSISLHSEIWLLYCKVGVIPKEGLVWQWERSLKTLFCGTRLHNVWWSGIHEGIISLFWYVATTFVWIYHRHPSSLLMLCLVFHSGTSGTFKSFWITSFQTRKGLFSSL